MWCWNAPGEIEANSDLTLFRLCFNSDPQLRFNSDFQPVVGGNQVNARHLSRAGCVLHICARGATSGVSLIEATFLQFACLAGDFVEIAIIKAAFSKRFVSN